MKLWQDKQKLQQKNQVEVNAVESAAKIQNAQKILVLAQQRVVTSI